MNASFEEKSAWIQLVSLVAVLGGYFLVAGRMLAAGVSEAFPFAGIFTVAVVLLVVILGVGHAIAALASGEEGRDERDRLIEWRSESNSGWILAIGVLGGTTCLVFSVSSAWVANILFFSLFLSEVAKLMFQLAYYRRGI